MMRTAITLILVLATAGCSYWGHLADKSCREKKRSGEKTECKTNATAEGMAIDTAVITALRDKLYEREDTDVVYVPPQPCLEGESQACSVVEDRCWCEPPAADEASDDATAN